MKLAYEGPIDKAPASITDRRASFEHAVDAVRPIRDAVRARGDDAVREYTARFDGWTPQALEVDPGELQAALRRVPPGVQAALEAARANI